MPCKFKENRSGCCGWNRMNKGKSVRCDQSSTRSHSMQNLKGLWKNIDFYSERYLKSLESLDQRGGITCV